jgi:uncharacterized protein YdiU (UPF0061 family)
MNTDNTSISGETIAYGPCAFMDAYDSGHGVHSSIDHLGRYAYGNQPNIAQWNLARLAETLLPLLAEDEAKAPAATESLGSFAAIFHAAYAAYATQARSCRRARGRCRACSELAVADGRKPCRLYLILPPSMRRVGSHGG